MKKHFISIYWIIPVVLFILQIIFTFNSTNQIRYEELAESVRNPFWLQNQTIYDGISSNVGWYGILLIIYKIFGFSLFTAKYFRLFLSLISLLCLASVLRKYLGEKLAWLPLITIGMSPTLLYFNTLQASYGTDLQYFPIALFLITSLRFNRTWLSIFQQIAVGVVSMLAWMSYPTFIFYLLPLGLLYFWQVKVAHKKLSARLFPAFLTLISFVAPLSLAFLFVKDKTLLLYDPVVKSGILRGAGNFYPSTTIFWQNIAGLLGDLFAKPSSYYFEIATGDFSHIYPLLPVLLTLLISLNIIFTKHQLRGLVLLTWIVMLSGLIIANLTFDPSNRPGIRRNTVFLSSIYALFTIVWFYFHKQKWDIPKLRNFIMLILLLIPIHHSIAYPINLLEIKKPSVYQEMEFYNPYGPPDQLLSSFLQNLQKEDIKLVCQNNDKKIVNCRYSEVYAALAGSCSWNSLLCHNILGYDPKTQKYIPLSISLWENYYFSH